jgi:hypothetical protein
MEPPQTKKLAQQAFSSAAARFSLDLAPFAFTVRARSARTVNAGFGGAKRRRNQLVENAARSELA